MPHPNTDFLSELKGATRRANPHRLGLEKSILQNKTNVPAKLGEGGPTFRKYFCRKALSTIIIIIEY